MSQPKVAFTTLGCRLNQAESDAMSDELAARGFARAGMHESPDIVVVNTCTVTREATKASRSALRRAVRDAPDAKVVAIGCYAVSDPAEVEAIAGVDLVLSNDDKEAIVAALGAAPSTAPLLQLAPPVRRRPSVERPAVERVRANLKVQTGCDEWCSFCIIPVTRGPLRSLPEDALVEQARARVEAGAREIVLTGVHLGKYAYDRGGGERHLLRLLGRLLEIDDLWRLRLSSILSRHLTDEVVAFIAEHDRICRHLHVPIQSGDDAILKAMHRPYRIGDFVERVQHAQRSIPGLALATDVIVGFPGESDDAFEATMAAVRKIGFSKLHVFRYSPRPGTVAAALPDAVDPEVKRERSKRLIDLGNELRARFLAAHVGRSLQVLVEDERDVHGASICSGQTSDYVRVWLEGRGLLGAMVDVTGARVRSDGIEGALAAGGGRA